MDRLEHRHTVLADVGPRRDAQATDEPGDEVADDVAVEVRCDQDVVEIGLYDELHAHVVDDPVFELDLGVVLCDLARDA